MHKYLASLILALSCQVSLATNLVPGERIPDLEIADRGEIILENDEFSFRPWQYPQQTGRIHVVNYMAATMGASKLNEPFTDRLQLDLEQGSFHVTTILNLDDALWGTSGFVLGEVKSNKRKHPQATLVLDRDAHGLKAWQLDKKSSAIVVLDGEGRIHYVKQGAMSEQEIQQTIEMIRAIQKGSDS